MSIGYTLHDAGTPAASSKVIALHAEVYRRIRYMPIIAYYHFSSRWHVGYAIELFCR